MPISPFIKRRRQQKRQKYRNLDRQRGITERNPLKRIEATVRKADEDKVENCTADVDALLVFAGLYSAVLTAFLIESYKNLSADETNTLLQQMVSQTANYRVTDGYLNSTFDPSLLPAFKAAVSDIRVNVCWFASLILSLSAASFGIAVKQWLREYLSIDCIDPLERLRIRHDRFEGLRDWKLFQIAAFLPILLQISLALFFVGLCFFTAAVHRSIEITSLFLVSCWAFFFFMSVIAPLFSPRCPYKTTLLKVPFRYARPYFQSFLRHALRPCALLLVYLQKVSIKRRRNKATGTGSRRTRERSEKLKWHEEHFNLGIIHELSSGGFRKDSIRGEEDMLRSADGNDIIVFCDVDGVFLDDNLLRSMCRTLGENLDPLPDALRFVTGVIQRRSGFTLAEAASRNIEKRQPWSWTLSPSLRYDLVSVLVNSMEHELRRVSPLRWRELVRQDSEWSGAFVVLVSLMSSYDATPSSVTLLFQHLHEYQSRSDVTGDWGPLDVFSFQMWTWGRCDPDWSAQSLLFLAGALQKLSPEDAEQRFQYIAHVTFVDQRGEGGSGDTCRLLLRRNPDNIDGDITAPVTPMIVVLLDAARVLLHRYTVDHTQEEDKFPLGISLLLEFVFNVIPKVKDPYMDLHTLLTGASDAPGLRWLVTGLFTTPHRTRALLDFFATHVHLLPSSSRSDQSFFLRWISAIETPSRDTAIAVLEACTAFFESHESHPILDLPAVLLRFCFLTYHYNTREDQEVDASWKTLFSAIHGRYRRFVLNKYHANIQLTCSYSVSDAQHTDTCNTAYALLGHCTWSPYKVPNEMVAFLGRFVCAWHTRSTSWGRKFDRILRLEGAEEEQTEVGTSGQPYSSSGDEAGSNCLLVESD